MVRLHRVHWAVLPMCHPQVIESRTLMRHDEGNTWKSQDNHEGLRALPLKSMECALFCGQVHRESVTHGKSMLIPEQISEGFWPSYDRGYSASSPTSPLSSMMARSLSCCFSKLDFCPSVRQCLPGRCSLGSCPCLSSIPRGPGRIGWFPGRTARVLRTPVHEPVCENTTVPTVNGVHM
jgi:hypothetical protein